MSKLRSFSESISTDVSVSAESRINPKIKNLSEKAVEEIRKFQAWIKNNGYDKLLEGKGFQALGSKLYKKWRKETGSGGWSECNVRIPHGDNYHPDVGWY